MDIKKDLIKLLGEEDIIVAKSVKRYEHMYPENFALFGIEIVVDNKCLWKGDVDFSLKGKLLKEYCSQNNINFEIYQQGSKHMDSLIVVSLKEGIFGWNIQLRDLIYEKDDNLYKHIIEKEEAVLADRSNFDGIYDDRDKYPREFLFLDDDIVDMTSSDSPYSQLFSSILKESGKDCSKFEVNNSKLFITEAQYRLLEEWTKEWLVKKLDLKEGSYELEHHYSYIKGVSCPLIFNDSLNGPTWAVTGCCYGKEDIFVEKENS